MNAFGNLKLVGLDWIFIIVNLCCVLGIAAYFTWRGSKSTDDFFVAGRKLPWWLAGTSIVATMFAADTPLFHSGNVRRFGLDAGWMFFFPGFGVVLASVLFARLWRRTRVITEIELLEMRYSGEAASWFRGFNAIYGGAFTAALTVGWVALAMNVILESFLGLNREYGIWILLGIVLLYSVGAGIWGVVITDLFQYFVATTGSLILAYKAVQACGGFASMQQSLAATGWGGTTAGHLRVIPDPAAWNPTYTWWLILGWIFVFSVSTATSGGFMGQRIYACKDEKNASNAVLWFGFCYYLINGWSWLIVGAASILVLGVTNQAAGMNDFQETFPAMIMKLMPAGLRGFMVASLIAAFISSVGSILNWGSSYLVNDFYRRFMVKEASNGHYVWISRATMIAIALFGGWFSMQFANITEMLLKVSQYLTGGVLVLIVRWLWSRTNIWSEISAMAGSVVVAFIVDKVVCGYFGVWASTDPFQFYGQRILTILAATTVIWVVVTLLTKPVSDEKLIAFYKRVAPPGPGWRRIRQLCGADVPPVDSFKLILLTWLSGIVGLFGLLSAVGYIVAWRPFTAGFLFVLAAAGGVDLPRFYVPVEVRGFTTSTVIFKGIQNA